MIFESFPIIIFVLALILTMILIYLTYKFIFKSKLKNYIIIKDYDSFSKYINDFKKAKQIGADTEYYHDNTYKGILCLIQLYITKYPFSFIIDLIELQNKSKENDKSKIYSELKNIFENKKIEKIFHSCYNDIKWIFEEINCDVINIFDTQLMDNYVENKLKKNIIIIKI